MINHCLCSSTKVVELTLCYFDQILKSEFADLNFTKLNHNKWQLGLNRDSFICSELDADMLSGCSMIGPNEEKAHATMISAWMKGGWGAQILSSH